MNRILTLLLLTLTLATLPLPAYAADGTYVTTVTRISPALRGVSASASPDGESITVLDRSATPIVVEGYQHEPYRRITSDGVWENQSSPATYLNKESTIGSLPSSAAADKPARWKKISPHPTTTWHDHRIHWMGSAPPPAVAADPGHTHLVSRWKVPITAGSTHAFIEGTLVYHPGSHLTTYLAWTAGGVVVVVLVVLQIVTRRRLRSRRPDEAGPAA